MRDDEVRGDAEMTLPETETLRRERKVRVCVCGEWKLLNVFF